MLAWFYFPNFSSFSGHVFVVVNSLSVDRRSYFKVCVRSGSHIFNYQISFVKIRHHGSGKESRTSNLGSQQLDGQLDHVAAISFTSLDKTLGVRPCHFNC